MIVVSFLLNLCGGSRLKAAAAAGGILLVVLALAGMGLKLFFLSAENEQLRLDVQRFNATVVTEQALRANAETRASLAEADEAELHKKVAGLQGQVTSLQKTKRDYIKRLARSQELDRRSVTVSPEQTSGVIDDETSRDTVYFINSVLLRTEGNGTAQAASADY